MAESPTPRPSLTNRTEQYYRQCCAIHTGGMLISGALGNRPHKALPSQYNPWTPDPGRAPERGEAGEAGYTLTLQGVHPMRRRSLAPALAPLAALAGFAAAAGFALFAPAASAAEGTIAGKATFKGEAPARKEIDTKSDPNCCKDHPAPKTEDVIVDKDGGLKNVVIYVKEGLEEGKEFKPPTTPVVIDQRGCAYTPHVNVVMVGQPVKITNSDDTLHNVHGLPRTNSEFNVTQNKKGSANEFTFKDVENPGFVLKCDVHPWMKSFIWVLPHPYFAISKDDGTFELKLPPGEYTIEAWQERCAKQEHKIKVEDGKKVELNLSFEMRKKRG